MLGLEVSPAMNPAMSCLRKDLRLLPTGGPTPRKSLVVQDSLMPAAAIDESNRAFKLLPPRLTSDEEEEAAGPILIPAKIDAPVQEAAPICAAFCSNAVAESWDCCCWP